MKKVALLLYGSHRTVFECWNTTKTLLDPTKYEVVPFFYFWDSGDRERNNSLVELINPAHFRFGLQPNFDFVQKKLLRVHPLIPETIGPHINVVNLVAGIYLRCYAMQQVNYLRAEYEFSHDTTFDWYWLARPDINYCRTGLDLEWEINNSERLYGIWSKKEDMIKGTHTLLPVEEYEACIRPEMGRRFLDGEPVTEGMRGLDLYKRPMGMVKKGFKLGTDLNIAVLPYRPHYNFWNDQVVFLTRHSVNTWTKQYEWMITDAIAGNESYVTWSELFTKHWNNTLNGTQMVTIPIEYDIWRSDDTRYPSDYQWVWERRES